MSQQFLNFQRIEKAIQFMDANFKEQPDLDVIADYVNLSPFHFQKLFLDWVGLTPKKFLQYITFDYLKGKIRDTQNMIDAAEVAGLSGQSRVHDLFVSFEGVTPQQYKLWGQGIKISYGYHPTPFGMCFIAVAERGICRLHFIDEDNKRDEFNIFLKQWHLAELIHDPAHTQTIVQRIFSKNYSAEDPMKVIMKGTNFQLKVWEGLLKVPYGSVTTFHQFSQLIGESSSVRSVASAVGKNPIPFLIPCHRIIANNGTMGQYHWGRVRKKLLLGSELVNSSLINIQSVVSG
jgi:AraC family transcriptional regulator of adaptative response/methylated-DNA-[protein]-cysteine methyltransferase